MGPRIIQVSEYHRFIRNTASPFHVLSANYQLSPETINHVHISFQLIKCLRGELRSLFKPSVHAAITLLKRQIELIELRHHITTVSRFVVTYTISGKI